jgi:hypothetical protein
VERLLASFALMTFSRNFNNAVLGSKLVRSIKLIELIATINREEIESYRAVGIGLQEVGRAIYRCAGKATRAMVNKDLGKAMEEDMTKEIRSIKSF